MHNRIDQPASDIGSSVERIVGASRIMQNPYFQTLQSGVMTREQFQQSQRQFYFAVEFFSRPMSALLTRLPDPKQRLGILANVVEEHGDFQPAAFHEATFRQFLAALGETHPPQRNEIAPPAHAFNLSIMAACNADDVLVGIACLGIIEYAFAEISALIGGAVVRRGWLSEDALVHYSLHAELDKKHAADFFELLQDDWKSADKRAAIERGLWLGGYVFDRLYRDLLKEEL